MKNIFYNSSMPRSMSTLLQNLLAQNPAIHATPTDGVLELLFGARMNYTKSPEFTAQDSELMLKAWNGFCWNGLQGYAEALTDKPNVCIKSRGIGIHYKWFEKFYTQANQPKPKVLVMVRDIRQIFSSMEKLYRLSPERFQEIQNHAKGTGTTTPKRVQVWAQTPPVGMAIERLWDMCQQGIDKDVLFIRAEDLCREPKEQMDRIYEYLELDNYKHDFNNVKQVTQEDDVVYGLTPNLHTIKSKVKEIPKDYNDILSKELSTAINNQFKWYQEKFNYI